MVHASSQQYNFLMVKKADMKKQILVFIISFIGISGYTQTLCTLNIEIVNFRNNNGDALIEVYDSNQKSVASKKVKINNNKCFITIDSLPNEDYAIQYMHDENSNGKFDTNWMGIPLEGYGISNDAYGTFGPKSFSEWLFAMQKETKIVLTTKY